MLIFLIVGTAMIFAERYVEMSTILYVTIGLVLTYMIRMGELMNARLSVTFGFFALLHWMRPVNEKVTDLLLADVSGTYFLVPIILFSGLILVSPYVREALDWWQIDQMNRALMVQAMVAVAVGCGLMYFYTLNDQESLNRFIEMLPKGGLFKILALGIAFSLLNAVVEEYIIRGMFWNGLSKIISSPLTVNLAQASLFAISHYFRLPGGLIGVLMVFMWSFVMGHFRIKSGGILLVTLCHFALNLFQYFILYTFKP